MSIDSLTIAQLDTLLSITELNSLLVVDVPGSALGSYGTTGGLMQLTGKLARTS